MHKNVDFNDHKVDKTTHRYWLMDGCECINNAEIIIGWNDSSINVLGQWERGNKGQDDTFYETLFVTTD